MRIVRRNAEEIRLTTGIKELIPLYGFALFPIFIGVACLVFSGRQLMWEASQGMLRPSDGIRAAAAILFAALFLLFGWLLFVAYPAQDCLFDKRFGSVTIAERSARRFFRPRVRTFPAADISAVVLSRGGMGETRLAIAVDSGKSFSLTPVSQRGESAAGTGEILAEFLAKPLYVNIGFERIIRMPAGSSAEALAVPLNCAKCGGRLPAVKHGTDGLACPYCGTNMRIMWTSG
jgi:hypothetical protein